MLVAGVFICYNLAMENNSFDNMSGAKKSRTIETVLIIAAVIMLIVGIVLTVRQYILLPGGYEAPPTPSAAQEVSVVAPQPDGVFIEETPEPTPYVQRIPVKIFFTARDIMADIVPVGVIMEGNKTGKMETINDAILTAWYKDGPSPGEEGNALINGHVRWKGKAGTFSILPDMAVGEEVAIEYDDGSVTYFSVSEINYYNFREVPAEAMDLDWGGDPRKTLISCTGDLDSAAGTSSIRVFVVCVPQQ